MRASLLVAAVLLLVGLAACGEPALEAPTEPPSILLVTFDTTRADRLGAYGGREAVTPTLDRLAREGVVFEHAIAPTPITLPSHVSLLTGAVPPEHGVRDNTIFALRPEARLVSETLQRSGWRTAAFVGAYVLDGIFGLDQGFETYRAPSRSPASERRVQAERPANEVASEALAWILGLEPGERFFVWVHFFDPHQPYQAPEPFKSRLEDPYDAEIAFADHELGRLLDVLAERGRSANLLTVVTADHGESLGEHGEPTHGMFVYQSTLRVPLLFQGAHVAGSRGERISEAVPIIALPATLLTLAGLVPGEALTDRAPSLFAPDGTPTVSEDRAIYVETLMPYHAYRWRASRGLVWQRHKLIEGRSTALYALDDDPGELDDRAEAEAERVEAMQELLRETLTREPLGWGEKRGVEAGETELLQALGYVAGVPGEAPFAAGLPDPAEHTDAPALYASVDFLLQRALRLFTRDPGYRVALSEEKRRRGERWLREARGVLLRLRASDPGNPHVAVRLGTAESMLGNHTAALPLLEEARPQRPWDGRLRYHLALAYEAAGRPEEARRAMRAARAADPHNGLYARWLEEHAPGT